MCLGVDSDELVGSRDSIAFLAVCRNGCQLRHLNDLAQRSVLCFGLSDTTDDVGLSNHLLVSLAPCAEQYLAVRVLASIQLVMLAFAVAQACYLCDVGERGLSCLRTFYVSPQEKKCKTTAARTSISFKIERQLLQDKHRLFL